MRALVDENIPRSILKSLAPEIDAATVQEAGWSGTRNGELLELAAVSFELFITIDSGIPHQQNLGRIAIGLMLLEAPSNRAEDLAPLVPEMKQRLPEVKPGVVIRIGRVTRQ